MKTAMLLTPSLEEVLAQAKKIGLPDREAEKFFHYYESNGWKVGRVKMVSFTNAIAGWKLRYEDRVRPNSPAAPNGASTVILGKEYERVIEQMKTIRMTYGDHQTWRECDIEAWKKLRARRDDLRKQLGISV